MKSAPPVPSSSVKAEAVLSIIVQEAASPAALMSPPVTVRSPESNVVGAVNVIVPFVALSIVSAFCKLISKVNPPAPVRSKSIPKLIGSLASSLSSTRSASAASSTSAPLEALNKRIPYWLTSPPAIVSSPSTDKEKVVTATSAAGSETIAMFSAAARVKSKSLSMAIELKKLTDPSKRAALSTSNLSTT